MKAKLTNHQADTLTTILEAGGIVQGCETRMGRPRAGIARTSTVYRLARLGFVRVEHCAFSRLEPWFHTQPSRNRPQYVWHVTAAGSVALNEHRQDAALRA